MAFLFSTSSCALAFSYRSQVELSRKVCITYTTSSHGLQLALFGRTVTGLCCNPVRIGAERFALKVHSFNFGVQANCWKR